MAENHTLPDVDRIAASQAAVAARRERAAIKRDLTMRVITPQEVMERAFAAPGSPVAMMRITEFLTALPAIGKSKRDSILEELQISPIKHIGGLGVRQRPIFMDWLDWRFPRVTPRPRRSRLLVLAGPTAVGKGTVAAQIKATHPEIVLSVSATTRPPRPGEVDGEHYFFVDDAEFDRMIDAGEFLEHATVHNKYRYGTPRGPVDAALAAGRTVLLEIDLQGARRVHYRNRSAALIFLLPPSWEELVNRLEGRGTEDAEERSRRLKTAKKELAAQREFDFLVVNDDVARAADEIAALVR
ncbi:guanylate kinase [Microbacterium sp.]|uniref:guanylate kinase n=1 Tax=Microbacterium sp. TaxID=51671 RepID=UPI0039E54580